MQAVLCDVCGLPIRGEATELHLIRGAAVNTEDGRARIVQRGTSSMRFACLPCGSWIEQAIDHLAQSLRAESTAAHPLHR